MGTATLHFDGWNLAWRELWQRWAPPCGHSDCRHMQRVWGRLRPRPRGVILQGQHFCPEDCLERALREALRRLTGSLPPAMAPHRVPLGLLLLSRQQLTVEQLRTALAAQRSTGRGKIGEWLLALGFVTEQQVTAALARQWSCPILRTTAWNPKGSRAPQIPVTLLEAFVMIPVEFVQASATLHLAFGEGIDYRVLYAVEQMLGCHTAPCMAVPTFVRQTLQALAGPRGETEVVFDRMSDGAEFSRIVLSYCVRLGASEIRLAACGPHLWVRLLRPSRPPLDLILRSHQGTSLQTSFSPGLAGIPPSKVPALPADISYGG